MGRISAYFSYVVLVLAVLAQPASAVVIKGYDSARTEGEYGLTESALTTTVGYIADPVNFGPNGTVSQKYQVGGGINVATPSALVGTDVFFTGFVPTNSYTPAEKTALYNFVLGGKTLIATTDDTAHTMVDAFGLTQGNGSGNPIVSQTTNGSHPIVKEPFGDVRTYHQHGAAGHYPTLGPAGEVGANSQGATIAVIERGALGPNSGAAIFVADIDVFTNDSLGGGVDFNQYLIKNIFAFAIPATYPRPQSAASYRTSLVPAFKQCNAPNSTHAAPIARSSCTPPELVGDELTVGTPDANGRPAKFTGYVKMTVLEGNPSTVADEADNHIEIGLTDVRRQSDLADYTGELLLRTSLRITDKLNGPPQTVGGTVRDFNLPVVVPCTATSDTTVGSSCTLNTTLDSLTPGTVREGKRSVTHMGDVLVYDGGADSNGDTQGDNTVFAWEGLFTP